MLKKMALKKIIIASVSLIVLFLIWLFPTSTKKTDTTIVNDYKDVQVFLENKNNLLGKVSVTKVDDTDDIKFIISLLTKNSINSTLIPLNFKALLPQNTKLIYYEIKDNILILNFSNDFLLGNEDYEKIIESLIYTFCIDDIKGLTIKVEDSILNVIPNTDIKLNSILDKSFGINKKYNIDNVKNTTQTTIYYLVNDDNIKYYLPITKISNDNNEKVEIIIKELKKTQLYEPNLISYLNASYELENYEVLQDSINIYFKDNSLYSLNDTNIIEEIKYTLSESIKDTYNINNVEIVIN